MERGDLEPFVMSIVAFVFFAYFFYKSLMSGEILVSLAIIIALIVTFILVWLYKRGIKKQAKAYDEWFELEK